MRWALRITAILFLAASFMLGKWWWVAVDGVSLALVIDACIQFARASRR